MNLLTEGRQALLKRLEVISVGAGYNTAAGANVRSGWFNEVLKEKDVTFPLIVLQKGRGKSPEPGPGALMVTPGFNVIGAVDAGLDGYESAIEDLEHDLLRCLMPVMASFADWLPRGITGISIGSPESFPPGEGMRAATVVIPVYLTTIIKGS